MFRKLSFALPAAIALMWSGSILAHDVNDGLENREVSIVTSEGLTLAGWVSRPAGSEGRLPALFLTQWVSCDSAAPGEAPAIEMVAREAGYALIRVERSGTGESEGPGCDQLDYETEVRHYREALEQLRSDPWVNDDQIVIIGSSLGSTTAPLVALDNDVAGVVVQGGGGLSYFERMIHFDRWHLERGSDFDPMQIDRELHRRFEFQWHYLRGGMTPEEIEVRHPHLAGVWESLRGTNEAPPHYGRPYAWHQQAAQQDWLSAWAQIEAPVLVVYAEFDQFESRHGHEVIVDTVNRLRPGTATFVELPNMGHSLRVYPDKVSAYSRQGGIARIDLYATPVASWLRALTR